MSAADRAIRVSTAVAVLGVAGIAAYVSYWHAFEVVRAHGETGITAQLEPTTIDGLVYSSSMVVLYAARHRRHRTVYRPGDLGIFWLRPGARLRRGAATGCIRRIGLNRSGTPSSPKDAFRSTWDRRRVLIKRSEKPLPIRPRR